jgi:RHS repeat-associated protein
MTKYEVFAEHQKTNKNQVRQTGNYYYGARYYNPKWSTWLSVDPLAERDHSISPYAYAFNNPINFTDPNGLWPVYSKDGEFLGDDGLYEKGKDLAFTGTAVRDSEGNITGFENLEQFTDNHSKFTKAAGKVKKESSGNKLESLWIAHTANNASKNPDTKKGGDVMGQLLSGEYSTTTANSVSIDDNSNSAKYARSALINVLLGGSDPTNGATHWDGQDFLPKGINHNKFKEFGTVSINSSHLKSFIASQRKLYGTKASSDYDLDCVMDSGSTDGTWGWTKAGNFFASQRGNGKTYYNLSSVGVQGGTLFWKAEKKK